MFCSFTQADAPEPLTAEVQAALITEYISSYVFKSDDSAGTATFLATVRTLIEALVRTLQSSGKTADAMARSVLAKVMNVINKSVTLGAVYVSHLMFGHKDAWVSYNTRMVNLASYAGHHSAVLADALFSTDTSAYAVDYKPEPQEGMVVFTNEVEVYEQRHESLSNFSPLEIAMAFDCRRLKNPLFPLKAAHPLHLTHGHAARRHYHYPQFLNKFPSRPSDTAPQAERDDWARFVLILFTPWTTTESLGAAYPGSPGEYWDK